MCKQHFFYKLCFAGKSDCKKELIFNNELYLVEPSKTKDFCEGIIFCVQCGEILYFEEEECFTPTSEFQRFFTEFVTRTKPVHNLKYLRSGKIVLFSQEKNPSSNCLSFKSCGQERVYSKYAPLQLNIDFSNNGTKLKLPLNQTCISVGIVSSNGFSE